MSDKMQRLTLGTEQDPEFFPQAVEQLEQLSAQPVYKTVTRIISGGQRGADRWGLIAARDLGLKTGGTAPKGWRVQLPDESDGSDPDLAGFGLVEHTSPTYPPRTKKNVEDSDGTLWVGYEKSGGGRLTIGHAQLSQKQIIVNPTPEVLREWLQLHQIRVLNVAGNRASSHNLTIEAITYCLIVQALAPMVGKSAPQVLDEQLERQLALEGKEGDNPNRMHSEGVAYLEQVTLDLF